MDMRLNVGQLVYIQDPEPWGKAFSYSVFSHAALLMFLLLSLQSKPGVHTVLTEINYVEKQAPIAEPVKATAPEKLMLGQGGKDKRDTQVVKRGIDTTGGRGNVKTHSNLTNRTAVSSSKGSPGGDIVTSEPMTGPIVGIEQFGIVGRQRGQLKQLAGDTGGTKKGNISIPLDSGYRGKPQIALGTMDIGELQKKESSIGVPLISQGVVTGSVGGRIRELAKSGVGSRRKAGAENLKSNPLDRDKWGKSKGPFSMEGPLKYRKILKMDLPPYPRWAEEKAIETSVSFRLWCDPKGRVKDNMYLEKTSGYSELDHLAKEALLKFIFVPIPSDQPQEDEWGVATFRFELTK